MHVSRVCAVAAPTGDRPRLGGRAGGRPAPVVARDFEAPDRRAAAPTPPRPATPPARHRHRQTGTITIPAGGCDDTWLTDLARAGNTQRVDHRGLPAARLRRPRRPSTTSSAGARRSSASTSRTPRPSSWSFLTEDATEREPARHPGQRRAGAAAHAAGADGIGNLYIGVLGFSEQRIVTAGDRRRPPLRRLGPAGRAPRPRRSTCPLAPPPTSTSRPPSPPTRTLKDDRATYDAVALRLGRRRAVGRRPLAAGRRLRPASRSSSWPALRELARDRHPLRRSSSPATATPRPSRSPSRPARSPSTAPPRTAARGTVQIPWSLQAGARPGRRPPRPAAGRLRHGRAAASATPTARPSWSPSATCGSSR